VGDFSPLPVQTQKFFLRKNIFQEGEKLLLQKRRGRNALHDYYITPADYWKCGGRFCRCGGRHTRRGEKLTVCHSGDASKHKGSIVNHLECPNLPTLGEEDGETTGEVENFKESIVSLPPSYKIKGEPAELFHPQEQKKIPPPPPPRLFQPQEEKKDQPPPQKRLEAQIVISVPVEGPSGEEEKHSQNFLSKISPSRALLSRRVLGLEKVSFLLDSGANEFMFQGKNFLKQLGTRETRIKTASESGPLKGVFGTPQNFLFADGQTGIGFGKTGEAVFAEGLTENLASVGRLCEKGFFVVFGANRYQIFSEKNFSYTGRVVHSEARDGTQASTR